MTFAEILKIYMARKKLNNNQLAERLGVERQTIGNWVNGITERPHCDMVRKCIQIFGLHTRSQQDEFLAAAGCPHGSLTQLEPLYSQSTQRFVEQLEEHFSNSSPLPLLLLAQYEQAHLVDAVFNSLSSAYSSTRCCRIALPAIDCQEDDFYKTLAYRCDFSEPISKSSEFEWALGKRLAHSTPFFLLISRFENASRERAREIGGMLRSLWEQYRHLHLVLCGAQKLEELRYLQGEHSLLNHAETHYAPELTREDVQWLWRDASSENSLDNQTAEALLKISGGHLDWLLTCFKWYQQQPEFLLEEYPKKLSLELCDLFLPFIHHKTISQWLGQDKIAPRQCFITHPLLTQKFILEKSFSETGGWHLLAMRSHSISGKRGID